MTKPNANKLIIMEGLDQKKLDREVNISYYQQTCIATSGNHQSNQANKQKRGKYQCTQIPNLGA